MATFTKINDWMEYAHEGANLASDALHVILSNTAPASETSNPTASGNGIDGNVTAITYTNYTDSLTVDRVLESVTSNEATGTYTLDAADFTITASGGAIPDFRYIYIKNETMGSASNRPLVGVWDHGSTVSLGDGSTANINFNASGIYTVA